MKPSRLPPVVGQLFLAGDGFLGYRCEDCPFIVTGRTPQAIDAGMTEHHAFVHCENPLALAEALGDVNA